MADQRPPLSVVPAQGSLSSSTMAWQVPKSAKQSPTLGPSALLEQPLPHHSGLFAQCWRCSLLKALYFNGTKHPTSCQSFLLHLCQNIDTPCSSQDTALCSQSLLSTGSQAARLRHGSSCCAGPESSVEQVQQTHLPTERSLSSPPLSSSLSCFPHQPPLGPFTPCLYFLPSFLSKMLLEHLPEAKK